MASCGPCRASTMFTILSHGRSRPTLVCSRSLTEPTVVIVTSTRSVVDLYKELYFFEHDRKAKLTDSLALPIGVLGLLFGGVFFLFQHIPATAPNQYLAVWFFLTLAHLAVLLLLLTAYCLIRALHNYAYYFLPRLTKLEERRQAIQAHILALKSYRERYPNSAQLVMPLDLDETWRFDDFLIAELVEAGRINTPNNNAKSAWLYRGVGFLVAAVATMGGCMLLYLASI